MSSQKKVCNPEKTCCNHHPPSCCTFERTGRDHERQKWVQCRTCWPDDKSGACIYCSEHCHKGHDLGEIRESRFFCDCPCTTNRPKNLTPLKPTPVTLKNFSHEMLLRLPTNNNGSMCSPLATALVFAMLHSGANGDTAKEFRIPYKGRLCPDGIAYICNVMCKSDAAHESLRMSNFVLVQQSLGLKPEFQNDISKCAVVSAEDFGSEGATNRLNQLIAKATNGEIKDMLQANSLDKLTLMVTGNAIHFAAKWARTFDTKSTLNDVDFISTDRSKHKVQMMHQTSHFPYIKASGMHILEMECEDSTYKFVFVLPVDKPTPRGAFDHRILTSPEYRDALAKMTRQKVEVYLPRLNQSEDLDLIPVCQKMGIVKPFTDNADFSKMCNMKSFISIVKQKLRVSWDEQGARASVATVAVSKFRGGPSSHAVFNADHSFVYALYTVKCEVPIVVGFYDPKD